jgi:hypothetical protein
MKRLENNEYGGKAINRVLDDGKVGKRRNGRTRSKGSKTMEGNRSMKWECDNGK